MVAPWIRICLESVKSWAIANGYSYEFIDDRLFDFAPNWFVKRCSGQILPITDLARLYLLKDKLEVSGFDQAIWIDTDVAIFAPDFLDTKNIHAYALCGKIWIHKAQEGKIETKRKVNNSIVVMIKGNPMLDFLIFAGEEIVRYLRPGEIDSLDVGTKLLTQLALAMPLRVLPGAGLFSPSVILDIVKGGGEALDRLMSDSKSRIGAANLCGSLVGKKAMGGLDKKDMETAVTLLMDTQGEMINRKIMSTV